MFSRAHRALMVQLKEALSRTSPCRTNLANKVQKEKKKKKKKEKKPPAAVVSEHEDWHR